MTEQLAQKLFVEKEKALVSETFFEWKRCYLDRKLALNKLVRLSDKRLKMNGMWDLERNMDKLVEKDIIRNALQIIYTKRVKDNCKKALNRWRVAVLDNNYLQLCKQRVNLNERLDQKVNYILSRQKFRIIKVKDIIIIVVHKFFRYLIEVGKE